jgi:hypothetical protein
LTAKFWSAVDTVDGIAALPVLSARVLSILVALESFAAWALSDELPLLQLKQAKANIPIAQYIDKLFIISILLS